MSKDASDDTRADEVLTHLGAQFDKLKKSNGVSPYDREVKRLNTLFKALDTMVAKDGGEAIDSKWLFTFLAQYKKSIWISRVQALENVFAPGQLQADSGHTDHIEITYHPTGSPAGEQKTMVFDSLKRFWDKSPDGEPLEMYQAVCRKPFSRKYVDSSGIPQIDTMTARIPMLILDRRICAELQKYPELCTHGVPNVLHSMVAIYNIADHDYIHGIILPWRDLPDKPVPPEFEAWNNRLLGGAPLFADLAEKRPQIEWPVNYEVLSQRAAFEAYEGLNKDGVARMFKSGLNAVEKFRQAAIRSDGSEDHVQMVEAMCTHLTKNMARFASHMLPNTDVVNIMHEAGYAKYRSSKFSEIVQNNSSIPLGDDHTKVAYTDTAEQLLSKHPELRGFKREDGASWRPCDCMREAYQAARDMATRLSYPQPSITR